MKTTFSIVCMVIMMTMHNTTSAQSWEVIFSDDPYLTQIQFADDATLYMYRRNLDYEILKSSDKGNSWEIMQTFEPGFFTISGFKCKNADTVIAQSTYISAFTFDGMSTLDSIESPTFEHYQTDFNWAGENVYMSFVRNDTTFLIMSEDAGTSWQDVQTFTWPSHVFPSSLNLFQSYQNEDTAYFFHYYKKDRFLMSADGGYTLTEHTYSGDTIPYGLNSIALHPGTDFIYILVSWDAALRLNTQTWELNTIEDPVLGTLNIIDIDFYGDTVYALLQDGELIYSVNNGENWHLDSIFTNATSISVSPIGEIAVTTNHQAFIKKKESTSVSPEHRGQSFHIFPNPTKDIIFIEGLQQEHMESSEVYNSIGQKVYTGNSMNIDCTGWTPGFYILSIKDRKGHQTFHKFIKE